MQNSKMSLMPFLEELLDPQIVWDHELLQRRNALTRFNGSGPRVDLYPVEGGMELKADLPGFSKEAVKVTLDKNLLTISGERSHQSEKNRAEWYYAERSFGKFSHTVQLPYTTESSSVNASFENGVLTVSIPQPTQGMLREITIT